MKVDVIRKTPCPRRGHVPVLVTHVFVDADNCLLERDCEEDGRHGVPLLHSFPHPPHETMY